MPDLTYQVQPSKTSLYEFEAVAYDGDGTRYGAYFTGPEAEKRATEYALWQNGVDYVPR